MSAWDALRAIDVQVRPLADPPPLSNRVALFRSTFGQTVKLLRSELEHLDAERVVLELDVRPRDLRLDGLPRADARLGDPAVVLSFESRHGPLRYATGEYDEWQDNLRAIALSLEALRSVDRYGVSRRGEQYKGWAALAVSNDPADRVTTRVEAFKVLERWIPDGHGEGGDTLTLTLALRAAILETHPDRGGNSDQFRTVMKAKEVLGL